MNKNLWIGASVILIVFGALAVGYFFGGHRDVTNTTVSNAPVNLSLQSQCAAQAQSALITFEKQMGSGYSDYAQQNHYNPNFEKCFALISYAPNVSAGTQINTDAKVYEYPTNIETLEDAYENSDLADCTYYGNLIGVDPSRVNANPESSTNCLIENNTATYQQYKEFVSDRMALSE